VSRTTRAVAIRPCWLDDGRSRIAYLPSLAK
jgi:hypothetical protein